MGAVAVAADRAASLAGTLRAPAWVRRRPADERAARAGFRPDIEGLRAWAILPILLFHLDPRLLPGGFVGVDIFFVISGYVVTGMILRAGDGFRLGDFFIRRLLRLAPALLATLAGSLAAGWFLLSPSAYRDLAASAVWATVAGSNIGFLATVDYFNAASHLHPLLHTWSLAVEEQFYLVWPVLILLVGTRRPALLALSAGIACASLLAGAWYGETSPDAAFYLAPFRMFEFAAGAGLVILEAGGRRAPRRSLAMLGAVGFGLIAFALLTLNDQTSWPGPATLAPVAGTVLLLAAGREGFWKQVLANALFRGLGRLSYALYLVHWPIIVFTRTALVVEPSPGDLALISAASLAGAMLLHIGIERPMRVRAERRADGPGASERVRLLAVAGAALLVVAASSAVVATGGASFRTADHRVQARDGGLSFAGDLCDFKASRCAFGDPAGSRQVHLMGDSHALNLLAGLDELFGAHGIKGIAHYDHGCPFVLDVTKFGRGRRDDKCSRHVAEAFEALQRSRDPVLIAMNYADYRNEVGAGDAPGPVEFSEDAYADWLGERLRTSLLTLEPDRRTVVLFKQGYATGADVAACLTAPGATEDLVRTRCAPMPRSATDIRYKHIDRMIDGIARTVPGLIVVDPRPAFCPEEACIVRTPDGLLFRDPGHLTVAGSRFVVQRIARPLVEDLRIDAGEGTPMR